jgi:RHS repeat-associated protein
MNNGVGLGYTEKPYDTVIGMYNYGYRDYSPAMARFTTEDPVQDGANWFTYVNNDPVNWIDPFGLRPLKQEEIQHHKDSNGMAVDYSMINVEDRSPTKDDIKAGLISVGVTIPNDNEIEKFLNGIAAVSLPDGNIYIPPSTTSSYGPYATPQEEYMDVLASEINHQAQYQKGDPKAMVTELMSESKMGNGQCSISN